MTSQVIISLAMLKVNADIFSKDYLENFVPIVAECIRLSQEDVVSLPILQIELKNSFGLQIPQNSIKAILKHIQRHGYISLQNQIYTRNSEKLKELDFHSVQQQVLRMHESVIRKLIEFCSERFAINWDTDIAEKALHAYIEENQLSIVAYSRNFIPIIPPLVQVVKGAKYIVGSFIQHLQETHASDFEYLETIVKGNLLANAIFLTEVGQADRKFYKTSVYLDTSFLLFALGCAGEARRDPCIELLYLLYENGADLKCFTHTLDEARGVLDACAHRIRQGHLRDAYGPSIEYFISIGKTPSDIELMAINLEKDITALRIRIVDKPPYLPDYDDVIDEGKLANELAENISYHSPQAVQRDLDSISGIMRLRHGRVHYLVEKSIAVFVTTNTALVKITRDYYYQEAISTAVPPCIPDYVLTNLLWLKKPLRAPDLPRKRIIADYYAATQPDDRLWKCYLAEIEKLKQAGNVTTDDYYLLRYSHEAKAALMDTTLGVDEAFSQGSIPEILSITRANIQKEKDDEINKQLGLKIQAEEAVLQSNRKEQARLARIKSRSQKYASRLAWLIRLLLLALLAIGIISTFPWDLPAFSEKPFRYVIPGLQLLLLVLSVLNLVFGTMLETYIRSIEVKLSNFIEQNLLKLTEETNI